MQASPNYMIVWMRVQWLQLKIVICSKTQIVNRLYISDEETTLSLA
jgi:hypothetical protein